MDRKRTPAQLANQARLQREYRARQATRLQGLTDLEHCSLVLLDSIKLAALYGDSLAVQIMTDVSQPDATQLAKYFQNRAKAKQPRRNSGRTKVKALATR